MPHKKQKINTVSRWTDPMVVLKAQIIVDNMEKLLDERDSKDKS